MKWKRDDQKWISCDQTRGEKDQKSDDEMRKGSEVCWIEPTRNGVESRGAERKWKRNVLNRNGLALKRTERKR